ncbi:MAG: hypothetical protein OEZ22_03045 [Spirochaetia bacterium]|nr:hypothetical protein [Spirochaetia bacterium]
MKNYKVAISYIKGYFLSYLFILKHIIYEIKLATLIKKFHTIFSNNIDKLMNILNINKQNNIFYRILLVGTTTLFVFTGCSQMNNDYASTQNEIATAGGCGAKDCHPITPLAKFPPTTGIHTPHLAKTNPISGVQVTCTDCHYEHLNNPLHKNGTINGYDSTKMVQSSGNIINFDEDNPNALWHDESGTCMNVACHKGEYTFIWDFEGTATDPTTGEYTGDTNCLSCHTYAIPSNIQALKVTGLIRRAIKPEFPENSTHAHYGAQLDSNDCKVCHYIDAVSGGVTHRSGDIYLYAMDNEDTGVTIAGETGYFYKLRDDKTLDAAITAKNLNLSNFCLGCHDSDGAAILAANALDPFGNGNQPPDAKTAFLSGNVGGVPTTYVDTNYKTTGYTYYSSNARTVNTRHDVFATDHSVNGTTLDCLDCHNPHTSAKEQPVVHPWARTRAYDFNDADPVLDRQKKNSFCLECHMGGETAIAPDPAETNPYKMQFPPRVNPQRSGTDTGLNEYAIDYNNWTNYYGLFETTPGVFLPGQPGEGQYIFLSTGTLAAGRISKWNSSSMYLDAVNGYSGSMEVLVDNTISIGDTFEFRLCPWWRPNCDVTTIRSLTYLDGYIGYGDAAVSNLTLIRQGTPGKASLIKGVNSGGYGASPWYVNLSWRFSPHGKDSKRTWKNVTSKHRYYDKADGINYAAELMCINCHNKHGSTNLYSINEIVDGSSYYNDGYYNGTSGFKNTASGTPEPIVQNLAPVQITTASTGGVYLAPLCEKCHYTKGAHGGHSNTFVCDPNDAACTTNPPDPQACVNCHNHGGIADKDGWLKFPGDEPEYGENDSFGSQDTTLDLCGNGILDGNPVLGLDLSDVTLPLLEECDDGNNINGDGCTNACEIEVEKPSPIITEHIPSDIIVNENGVPTGIVTEAAGGEEEDYVEPVGCFIGGDSTVPASGTGYLFGPTAFILLYYRLRRKLIQIIKKIFGKK